MSYIRYYTKDERGEFAFLSNDFVRRFQVWGKTFYSVHQYLVWRKAIIVGDLKLAHKVYTLKSLDDLAMYEEQIVAPLDGYIRETLSVDEFCAVLCKFKTNVDLCAKFKELSVNTMFVLCSRKDCFAGIGLDYNDKRRSNMHYWLGDNTSGKILFSVRHCLEEVQVCA